MIEGIDESGAGNRRSHRLVVIGASLGGLHALCTLLAGLSADFTWPLAIAQHRHKDSDGTLRMLLQQQSALPVYEAEDKALLNKGGVFLAPADYHLLIDDGRVALSIDEVVQYARPSIDVLFESAADSYGKQTIGVILTGASSDGAHGLAAIHARGGITIVQQPDTAECRVMPDAALAAVAADLVLPLTEIAPTLVRLHDETLKAYQ